MTTQCQLRTRWKQRWFLDESGCIHDLWTTGPGTNSFGQRRVEIDCEEWGMGIAYPCYEERNKEEQGYFRISPSSSVGLESSVALPTLHGDHASPKFRRRRCYVHGVLLIALSRGGASVAATVG